MQLQIWLTSYQCASLKPLPTENAKGGCNLHLKHKSSKANDRKPEGVCARERAGYARKKERSARVIAKLTFRDDDPSSSSPLRSSMHAASSGPAEERG
jgi:uncharacterized protein (DUF2126 family)